MSTNESWMQERATANETEPFDTGHQTEGNYTLQTMEECVPHDHSQLLPEDYNNRRFANFLQLDGPGGDQGEPCNGQIFSYDMDQIHSYLYLLKPDPFNHPNAEENQFTRPRYTQALSLLESTGDVRAVDFDQLNREICYQRW